ncbi:MAG: hypothetical protein LBV68_08070 [Spirochaetaceae bacterium]|jgi:hypothetical protein|nr:hypothetical protein [Spirochaetaceae bacterium]
MNACLQQDKNKEIGDLMKQWKACVADKEIPHLKTKESGKPYQGKDFFCTDGFFPNYFEQPKKILFIGRDPVGDMHKKGCIAHFLDEYKKNNVNNGERVDENKFHSRMMYIAKGIINGGKTQAYYQLESASCIAKGIGLPHGISFAFMELSKYVDDNKADVKLINSFLEHSELTKTDFFKKEIKILEPDIIITMNLWELRINYNLLKQAFDGANFIPDIDYTYPAALRSLMIEDKEIPIIDLYHFSSIAQTTQEHFYNPVMTIINDEKFKEKFCW